MKNKMGIIMVILITTFTGFGMIIPVMPEMVHDVGAAPVHLGWLLSVYSAVSFFLSPIWGKLSDRIGRRPVIMTGLLGFSLSFFLFGLAANHLWLMYVSRILGGLFSGAAVSSAVAYVADVTSEEERTKAMGLVGMSIGLGFILGPAIGGIAGHFNHALPFFIASLLALLTAGFAYRSLQESLMPEKRTSNALKNISRWAAFSGSLKYLYVLSFFVSFTLAGLESTLQYFEMRRIGASILEIGIMFTIIGVIGAMIQGGIVRKYVKKGTEPTYLLLGLILSALGFFLITFSFNFWSATLFVAIFGIGNAFMRPLVTSLITQKTTVGQGVASGLNSSMDSLGRILGPLLGTFMYQYNIYLPFIIGGILSILAISLLIGYHAAERKRKITSSH
jgi:DHA1 family multidrug resistance protein-like MFS transporter